MDDKSKKAITAKQIINLITPEFLSPIIDKNHADFHSRKLSAEILLKLLILGQLLSTRDSQRKMAYIYSTEMFHHVLPEADISVSHTAISTRLENFNADFFEQVYFNLLNMSQAAFKQDKTRDFVIDAVDSTMVRATSRLISNKDVMTSGPKGDSGDSRQQIKYTMIVDNVSAVYAKLHTLPAYLNEDRALYEAVMGYSATLPGSNLHKMSSIKDIFTFDRGLKGSKHLVALEDKDEAFVCRVTRTRKFKTVEGKQFPQGDLPEGVTIIADSIVNLTRPKSKGEAGPEFLDTPFRLVKANLGKEIGLRKGTAKKTETEIWILTDILDPEVTAAELLDIYKERWKIEVFFRFLKQNLGFAHMLSLNENGLTIVMYVSLITSLLLKLYCTINGYKEENGKFRLQMDLSDDIILESEQLAKIHANAKLPTHESQ